MTFPFDGEDHKLHIGESYSGGLQYHSVKYDFKPPSIDFDKEGILESPKTESDGTKCKIRFPNRTTAEQNKKSTVYEGKIQEIEKECILIIDRKTNTITLERVTSKVSVRNSRERDDKTYDFPAKRTLDRSAVSVSRSSSSASSRPPKTEKMKREPTLPVKKPRHELAAVKPKVEPDDLIMPTLGGGSLGIKTEPVPTTNIIGLGSENIKKERSDVKTEPSSIFSPDVNSESSSNSSSSDDSDDNDSDESSDQESPAEESPKTEAPAAPGDNTKEDLLNELYLSDSESDSDSNS